MQINRLNTSTTYATFLPSPESLRPQKPIVTDVTAGCLVREPHQNPVFTHLHAGHSHWPAATRHPHIRGDPGLWVRARSEIACMKWYGTNKEHCARSEKRRAITHHIERDEKWRVWLYWQNAEKADVGEAGGVREPWSTVRHHSRLCIGNLSSGRPVDARRTTFYSRWKPPLQLDWNIHNTHFNSVYLFVLSTCRKRRL